MTPQSVSNTAIGCSSRRCNAGVRIVVPASVQIVARTPVQPSQALDTQPIRPPQCHLGARSSAATSPSQAEVALKYP